MKEREEGRRSAGRWVYTACVVAVLAVAGGVTDLVLVRRAAEAREARTRRARIEAGPLVQTARVEVASSARTVTATGEVRAYAQSTLYAKLSGYVRRMQVDKGDRVKAGQVLAVLESPEVDQQVAAAQSDLALKESNARRARELAPTGVISQQDLDQAEDALRLARATLAQARASQSYAVIRAPFDGYVTARYVDPGALLPAATGATSSAQPVLDVADIDRVRVEVYLGQDDALAVRVGDEAMLALDPQGGAPLRAAVTRLTRSIEPRTRTMMTELVVANDPVRMYPGQFVKVLLRLERPPRPVVPADALVFRGKQVSVALVDGNRVRLVPVRPGENDGKKVEVLDGLRGGERVALNAGELRDGSPVQPAEAGRDPAR